MKSETSTDSLFEQAGGESVLRAVLRDFYNTVFVDPMIGFMFRDADKERLIQKEYELAASFLGAVGVRYTGKALRRAHAPHRIMGGQFMRRLQLLKDAMKKHDLPTAVQAAWIEHTERLRSQVTSQAGSDCE